MLQPAAGVNWDFASDAERAAEVQRQLAVAKELATGNEEIEDLAALNNSRAANPLLSIAKRLSGLARFFRRPRAIASSAPQRIKIGRSGTPFHTREFEFSGFDSPRPINPAVGTAPSIRIRCIAAAGDVLCAAAVAAALKKRNPTQRITFETGYPHVVKDNQFIDEVFMLGARFDDNERLIDLSAETDWAPKEHRLANFAKRARVAVSELEFFIRTEAVAGLPPKYLALHVGPTDCREWVGRNWSPERWRDLAEELLDDGLRIVAVGADASIPLPRGVIDLRGKTNVYQMASVVRGAHTFVGIESFPGIVAQALGVPCALFFGSVAAEYRIFRDNVTPVSAIGLKCLGCHHDAPAPEVTKVCRVGALPCEAGVTVGQFAAAVRKTMNRHNGRRATELRIPPAPKSDPPIFIRELPPALTMGAKTIVVKRGGTLGDVLVASSVAAALKARHPGGKLVFQTDYAAPLIDHPFVDEVVPHLAEVDYDVLANLDAACERLPYTNVLSAYAGCAGIRPEECRFYLRADPVSGLPRRYAAMFIGPVASEKRPWVGREWLPERFVQVAWLLRERGLATVLVGDERKNDAGISWPKDTIDLRGRTTIYELAHAVKYAELFVGLDSFPMHVAQAFDIPGVCFFGSIRPELRIYRESMTGISAAPLPCLGCHHEKRVPTHDMPPETSVCRAGGEPCRTGVSIAEFLHQVEKKLEASQWRKP